MEGGGSGRLGDELTRAAPSSTASDASGSAPSAASGDTPAGAPAGDAAAEGPAPGGAGAGAGAAQPTGEAPSAAPRAAVTLTLSRLAFHAAYPMAPAVAAMVEQLTKRGLRRSTARDRSCVFQWAPFTRVKWERALAGEMLVSSHYGRSGLIRKDLMAKLLAGPSEPPSSAEGAAVAAGVDAPPAPSPAGVAPVTGSRSASTPLDAEIARAAHAATVEVLTAALDAGDAAAVAAVRAAMEARGGTWVLKAAGVNNALGVRVCTAESFEGRLREVVDGGVAGGGAGGAEDGLTRVVVQRYIERPLLAGGRKFHMRVNVLARGFLEVFVHRAVVAHVATEPYVAGDWGNKWVHITNNSVQRAHPDFDASTSTLMLDELLATVDASGGADGGAPSRTPEGLFAQLCELVAGTFACLKGKRKWFLPLPNSFELYGFDVMLDDAWRAWLLEVNDGPALEAAAKPDLCATVVRDTVEMVLDPWLMPAATGDVASAPPPSADNGFTKVYEFAPDNAEVPLVVNDKLRQRVRALATAAPDA